MAGRQRSGVSGTRTQPTQQQTKGAPNGPRAIARMNLERRLSVPIEPRIAMPETSTLANRKMVMPPITA